MRGILQPNALPSNVIYPSVTSVYSIVDAFSKSINECVSGEIAICGKSITKVGFVLFFFKKENIVSLPFHLPARANFVEKSLFCPVDKRDFFRGTPEGTRTPNPQNRNLMLYPLSHRRIPTRFCSIIIADCGPKVKRYFHES